MSEHKGPWVRPNGNLITPEHYVSGEVRYVETLFPGGFNHHVKLPDDAVPLVPQAEVDITDPERLRRLAAELAAYIAVHVLNVPVGSESARARMESPSLIADTADRLEREQAEKAKRDKVRTALAETIEKYGENDDWEWCLGEADAILDRFDITPKEG